MQPDRSSPFGHYAPDFSSQSMISVSQKAPNNILGRQLAKLLLKLVKRRVQPPLDLQVAGIRLRTYLWDNYTERKLVFMPWRFDVRERRKILEALPRDGVLIDIGANVGVYTLIAANHMNSSGRILALEPYPPIHDRLCFNIEANREAHSQWPAISVLPVGVADKVTEFELHLNPANLGENSIVTDAESVSSGETVTIQCRPLLDILQEQAIERIDVLKIDIEGAEDIALCPFLAEAPQQLLPDYLLIENSEQRWKQDLTSAIKDRGYQVALRTRMNSIYSLPR